MYNTRVDGTPSDPRETKKVRNFGVIQIDSRADVRVQMGTKPAKVCGPTPLVTLVHALVADQRH